MNDKIKFLRGEIERIRVMHGGILQAEDVLEEAKNPASPLHPMFEWDNAAAAHQYRLDQARALIREVRVEMVFRNELIMAPFYVRHPASKSGYVAISEPSINPEEVLLQEDRAILALIERRRMISASFGIGEPAEIKRVRLFIGKRIAGNKGQFGHAA